MSKINERQKVIELRKRGYSYSEIKKHVSVSKSTLSLWLAEMPLSKEMISELRDKNPIRIEKFRSTMKKKKDLNFQKVLHLEKQKIGTITKRELYLMGMVLYWAEGTKSWNSQTELTNSDPEVIRIFMEWLIQNNVPKDKLKIRLHLYSDMDQEKEISFWSKFLKIPKNQFRKPMIKQSLKSRISYKGRHGHGTCQIIYGNKDLNDHLKAGIEYLRSLNF